MAKSKRVNIDEVKEVWLEPLLFTDEWAKQPLWTIEEMGAYWLLDLLLYTSCGKHKFDPAYLAAYLRITENEFEEVWEKVKSKFQISAGVFHHKSVTSTLRRSRQLMQTARDKALTAAQARWKDQSASNAQALPGVCQVSKKVSKKESKSIREFPRQDFIDKSVLHGLTSAEAEECYNHYSEQGWKFGNGLEIPNVDAALGRWKRNRHLFKKEKPSETGCIVCRQEGHKYKANSKGEKVWLCKDCFAALLRSPWASQPWANLSPSEIEKRVEQGKAKAKPAPSLPIKANMKRVPERQLNNPEEQKRALQAKERK